MAAACVFLIIQSWYVGWIVVWRWHDPSESAIMRHELARIRERQPQARLRQQWVPYERISPQLKRAVVAAEDARFVEHEGVDWEAVQKAYEVNRSAGHPVKGGSTISQQLAKNLFLSNSRSYLRKGEELLLTWTLEALWPKRRILEVYLNVVEWGDGVFGAEAAARTYFGIPAAQLDAEQSARLASFLPSPKRYGRIRTGAYLDSRADSILRYMPSAQIPN